MSLAILLSTYNGERFLQEQLDSLLAQTYSDWILIWRDDASTDQSHAIMTRFGAKIGKSRCIEVNDATGRLGAACSFLVLLQAAQNFPLIAFADQDDVWLPEKLARAAAAIGLANPDIPTLYCARQIIVDKFLNEIGQSFHLGKEIGFPAALLQNIATGCTVVLNRAASNLVASTSLPSGSVHDWWSYIVVSAVNGRVIFDTTPSILYRQHGQNTIGSAPSLLTRGWNAIQRGSRPYLSLLRIHATALQMSHLPLPAQNDTFISIILSALRGSRLQRLRLVAKKGIRRQTTLENILLIVWMLGRAPE